MKLHLLDRKSYGHNSLRAKRHKFSSFLKVWHYHPEIELVHITQSTGTRFVGDSIEKFKPGHVVLLGENLPHMWVNDPEYFYNGSNLQADAVAVHFRKSFLGSRFFDTYELFKINKLINRAKRGLLFEGIKKEIKNKILELPTIQGVKKIINLLIVLDNLSEVEEFKYLSSKGFTKSKTKRINHLDQVYNYIYENFHEKIYLSEVAQIAGMNPSAFSRFFKKTHKKTFIRYLNEIRIGYACKLLIEGKSKISVISYDCGFSNISNFNRQFKLIRKVSPTEFQNKYHKVKRI